MNSQRPQSVTLATEKMASLWQAAMGATLHGPRCTCVGFGVLRRDRAELERDIVEFLMAKYEERQNAAVVNLFQRWLDERTSGRTGVGAGQSSRADAGLGRAVRGENLLQWIDRNASGLGVEEEDLREIGADIRTLLESMAAPASGFFCA